MPTRSNFIMSICVFILYITCISCIILFQAQVHTFYKDIFSKPASDMINQTMRICNGPYFSYQLNNLLVMPFSLILLTVFTLIKREAINPFKKQNRFFNAALYCLLANEIFRMIETTMFHNGQEFNTRLLYLNESMLGNQSDFVRIGLGLQPESMKQITTTSKPIMTKANLFVFEPLMLRYSKPRLPPRLNWKNFETPLMDTTTTSRVKYIDMNDANLTRLFESNLNKTRQVQSKLDTTLNKTLFDAAMSLYENERVQLAMNRVFNSQSFNWWIVFNKFKGFGIMMLEVLVIGMR